MVTRMRFPRPLFAPVLLGILTAVSTSVQSTASRLDTLEPALQHCADLATGDTPVIIRAVNAGSVPFVKSAVLQANGTLGRALPIISSQAAKLRKGNLFALMKNPAVA